MRPIRKLSVDAVLESHPGVCRIARVKGKSFCCTVKSVQTRLGDRSDRIGAWSTGVSRVGQTD